MRTWGGCWTKVSSAASSFQAESVQNRFETRRARSGRIRPCSQASLQQVRVHSKLLIFHGIGSKDRGIDEIL
jgi:hypothetical protein